MESLASQLSLSSMWAVGRFETAAEFRRAAEAMGFDAVEFNYEAPPAWLDEPGEGVPIRSLHNPCPAVQVLNGRWSYSLSYGALDEDERKMAVALARTTIDHAERLGARAIVVHVATVPVDVRLANRLRELVDTGKRGTDEFWTVRDQLAAQRAANSGPHVEKSLASVRELAGYAMEKQVRLGLETRLWPYEIPNQEELAEMLAVGSPDVLGYWHDAGHAMGQELAGFGTHESWLQRFASRMIGIHLHGLQGTRDHFAVGLGSMDWDLVARYVPPEAIRVCEFDRRNPSEAVALAPALLRRSGVVSSAP